MMIPLLAMKTNEPNHFRWFFFLWKCREGSHIKSIYDNGDSEEATKIDAKKKFITRGFDFVSNFTHLQLTI